MTSLLRSVVIVVLLMATMQAPLALASDGWCDTDPILLIHTPAGLWVPVFVSVGAHSLFFTPDTLLGSLVVSYAADSTSGTPLVRAVSRILRSATSPTPRRGTFTMRSNARSSAGCTTSRM